MIIKEIDNKLLYNILNMCRKILFILSLILVLISTDKIEASEEIDILINDRLRVLSGLSEDRKISSLRWEQDVITVYVNTEVYNDEISGISAKIIERLANMTGRSFVSWHDKKDKSPDIIIQITKDGEIISDRYIDMMIELFKKSGIDYNSREFVRSGVFESVADRELIWMDEVVVGGRLQAVVSFTVIDANGERDLILDQYARVLLSKILPVTYRWTNTLVKGDCAVYFTSNVCLSEVDERIIERIYSDVEDSESRSLLDYRNESWR